MILGLVGKVLLKTIIKKQVLGTIFENIIDISLNKNLYENGMILFGNYFLKQFSIVQNKKIE